MRKLLLCVILSIGVFVQDAQAKGQVDVRAPRLHLVDVVPHIQEPWASVDLGASPAPLQEDRLTQQDILAHVKKARLSLPKGIELPRSVRVFRPGQKISATQLAQHIRHAMIEKLEPGASIQDIRVSSGAILPKGQIRVQLPEFPGSNAGQVEFQAQIRVVEFQSNKHREAQYSNPVQVLVHADIATKFAQRNAGVPVLARGAEVTVRIKSGHILLQASGLAQEPGSIGDMITVLPNQGTRALKARIVDARTVEVHL